jgi:hypothetical protein
MVEPIDEEKLLAYYRYIQGRSRTRARVMLRGTAGRAFGVLSRYAMSSPSDVATQKTDVLFLHTSPADPERIERLAGLLGREGVTVRYHLLSSRQMLGKREFIAPGLPVHYLLLPYAAYARYIVRRYRPKVLVTMIDSHPLSPFLRREMQGVGTYVNIAHSPCEATHYFSMSDFDYYIVFGKSSLRELSKNPVRIGSTRVILSGSPFISRDDIPKGDDVDPRKVLFFSTYQPPGDIGRMLEENSRIVIDWARTHPQFRLVIKLHPLEDPGPVRSRTRGLVNVTILDKGTTIVEALSGVSLAIVVWSSAAIEAAMMGKPIVIANRYELYRDFLDFPDYFPPAATTADELSDRVDTVIGQYPRFVKRTKAFLRAHIERDDSIAYTAGCLLRILAGRDIEEAIQIREETGGLAPYY